MTGWILFGVGAVTTLAGIAGAAEIAECTQQFAPGEEDCNDPEPFAVLLYGGGIMATTGLVMAIIGHVRRGVSQGRLRRWQRKYNQAGAIPLLERADFAVTMSGTRRGQGLALGLHF